MKLLTNILLLNLIIVPAKASIELVEEFKSSYTKISQSLPEVDSVSVINKIHSSNDLNIVSTDDWLLYSKYSKKKETDKEVLKKINNINFRVISNFTELFSFYKNEQGEDFNEDFNEDFKKSFIKSWWIAALVNEEECEELKRAYGSGIEHIIEKDDMAKLLINKIETYIYYN